MSDTQGILRGMIKLAVTAYVVGVAVAAVGEAVTAAIIGGGFTMLNTALLVLLNRKTSGLEEQAAVIQEDQQATKKALTAPRRIVYDQDGDPIGTVIDLRQGDDWAEWLAQHSRRSTDPEPPSPQP